MLGYELRLWRKGCGWTQERAAEEFDVSLRTYQMYEKNQRDIPLLAEHILTRGEREMGVTRRLSSEAMALVRAHPWPGNVRQLENMLRRLMVTATEPEIAKSEVEAALGAAAPALFPLSRARPLHW